jgi:restriction system protein
MTFLEAAEAILVEFGEPLHSREIVERALTQGLLATTGATPDATMAAQLAVDIRDCGTASRFQRTARGVFALRSWGLPEQTVARRARDRSAPSQPVTTMSFADAAEHVFEASRDNQPMHYKALWAEIQRQGLVTTHGLTPEQTLYSQILMEIQRRQKRGKTSRFDRQGRGLFGLSKWHETGLAYEIERHNTGVKKALLDHLKQVPPADFESLVERLLIALGFDETEVTRLSKDGGIDVRGTLVVGDVIRTRMAVQAKRWKNNVQSQDVQRVRGSLGAHEHGLIVTTSDFSASAKIEATRPDAVPCRAHGWEAVRRAARGEWHRCPQS